MNRLFIILVLFLSIAFGSLFYLAKCGHGGDAFVGGLAGGTLGGVIGSSIASSNNRREVREVEVIERSSDDLEARMERVESQIRILKKRVLTLENKLEELETAK